MKVVFWVAVLVAAAIYLTMTVWTMPLLMAEGEGLRPFDLRPFGYTSAEAREYLAAITEEGIAVYLGPQHMMDRVYPAVLALMFVTGELILFRRWLAAALIAVALIGAGADYMENGLVARLLTENAPGDALIGRASLATAVKSICATIGFVALIVGGLRAGVARLRGA
ncbi:hypothetical protein ATO6_02255 [Oceanicola sp. 22II-s10i]|uniref:hypothetical protein n=1 Tax=Oceanicola sp. 22II-s10i TaxID=1317116 RepID=UPI000B525D0E|nr:hypothetical protein [Oceanicola sp. 22II-s10i]OWU85758.1 hypothetical protein ATO6_02255 [Oceanicola sp. 22II-s10i]